jgi:hypothetical protein
MLLFNFSCNQNTILAKPWEVYCYCHHSERNSNFTVLRDTYILYELAFRV